MNVILGWVILILIFTHLYYCYKDKKSKSDSFYLSIKCFGAGLFGIILALILISGKIQLL